MQKCFGVLLAMVLAAAGYSFQSKPPEKQKTPPPMSPEEKEMLKNRELLENLELLQNFEQIQLFELLGGKKPEKGKDKPAAKPPAKGSGKPYES